MGRASIIVAATAVAASLALAGPPLPGGLGAEEAWAPHPKNCGLIARGTRDYRVRAFVVTCRFARRWSRAYLRDRSRPRGYRCYRQRGRIPFYCKRGDRKYWVERL